MVSTRRIHLVAMTIVIAVIAGCRKQQVVSQTAPRAKSEKIEFQDLRNARIHHVIAFDPTFLASSAIGSGAAADGSVSGVQREFPAGQPVHLTMNFTKSPEALETSVRFIDGAKKLVYGDMHAMNGAKSVTFTIPASVVRPGHYTAQGYWGGNLACEYPVDVKKGS